MGEIVTLTRDVPSVITPSERAFHTLCGRLKFQIELAQRQGDGALSPRTQPLMREIYTATAVEALSDMIDAANALRTLLEGPEPKGAA